MSDETVIESKAAELHADQKQRTRFVVDEQHRMANRLKRDRVAPVLQLCVFAYNCETDGKPHGHVDFVADGGAVVEGGYAVCIQALEAALAEIRKKVQ